MPRTGVLVAFLALVAAPALAEVYRWVDDNGQVHFDDRGGAGSEKLELEVRTVTTVTVDYLDDWRLEERAPAADRLVMFSTQWCGYCKKARRYFRNQGIPFTEKDIEASEQARAEYEKLGGTGGVPLIVQGRRTMTGFNVTSFDSFYKD